MKSQVCKLSFVCLPAIFLFLLILQTTAYRQELTLHEDWFQEGPFIVVHNNTPDYDFSKSVVACRYGFWIAHHATNYQNYYETQSSDTGACANLVRGFDVLSVRHVGASDTDDDALSLYNDINWQGEEFYIEDSVADIPIPIKSLGSTGKTNWMLYEGKNFEGKSHCLESPWSYGYLYYYDIWYQLDIPSIGSVRKGCDEVDK